jgi:hypothetical protein
MAVPAILMAVGTGLQVFSQWMANLDQAQAEYENSKFYEEQAGIARDKMNRDLDIADREYEYRKGATIGAEAAGGVDVGSGSAVNNIAAVAAAKIKELAAIKTQGEFEVKLARLRARRSGQTADTLSDTGYNLLQGATTGLNNYTASKGFGTNFAGLKKLDAYLTTNKEQNITGAPK